MDLPKALLHKGVKFRGEPLMIVELNTDAIPKLKRIHLSAQQLAIPPATAFIGGISYGSVPNLDTVEGFIIAGTGEAAPVADWNRALADFSFTPIDAWVEDVAAASLSPSLQPTRKDLYHDLRRRMESEGIPFLNEPELGKEIHERRGTRL